MPEDLKYIINQSQLTDIGDAIRTKLGEQDTYTVDEMPGKISEIGGSTKIVYIPEQTVTTQQTAVGASMAELANVNIDPTNPPAEMSVTLDGTTYTTELEIEEGLPGYIIVPDPIIGIEYYEDTWMLFSDGSGTHTIYAENVSREITDVPHLTMKVTNIGDAIREKLNEETTYTVDAMPEKISEIGGEGEISFAYCTITIINTSESTANLHLHLSEQCVVLSQYMGAPLVPAGTIIPLQQTIVIQPNIPRDIRALYVDYGNNFGNNTKAVAFSGLWGIGEDYSSILTNLNNLTVEAFQDGEQTNLYHYMLVVTDTTKPSSVTYTQELGLR